MSTHSSRRSPPSVHRLLPGDTLGQVVSDASVRDDVHALTADLLPVLVPDAELRSDPAIVVLNLDGARARISTGELVARCGDLPQHQWPRAVEEWLRLVGDEARTALVERRLDGDPHDRLRVVLGTPEQFDTADDALAQVSVPFGRYFAVAAVLDDGERARPLTKLRSGLLSLHDVGERALRNTLDLELPSLAVRVQQLTLRERATVVTLPGSPYVSTALLDIRRFLPTPCPFGALIGIPRASMLIVHPVVSDAVLDFLPDFAEIVHEMHDSAADACSHRAFWWADDVLVEVSVRPGGQVDVPRELEDLVRRLPKAQV